MATVPPPTAIVVGGSLGGLFAALWLEHVGFHTTILERSPTDLSSRGGGIVLHPSTTRYFTHHTAISPAHLSISTTTTRFPTHPSAPPIPSIYAPHRLASYNTLVTACRAHFPTSRYLHASHVVSVRQTPTAVIATTSAGVEHAADLLVCANGTASSLCASLLGEHTAASAATTYVGYVAWRGVVSEGALTSSAAAQLFTAVHVHHARDGHILTYPIPLETAPVPGVAAAKTAIRPMRVAINWVWYRNTADVADATRLLTDANGMVRERSVPPGLVKPELVEQLHIDALMLPSLLTTLVHATKQPFLQAVHEGGAAHVADGRACLLGDAAFTVRPHTAIATAKAAEDAFQLAVALRECGNDVVKALRLYDERQGKLGRFCLQRSKQYGEKLQSGRWDHGRALSVWLSEEGDSHMV